MSRLSLSIIAFACLANASVSLAAETVAGHIQFITGEATLTAADGSSRPATKGAAVDAGDRVHTGPATILQIKMTDGGLLSVRANSDMKIDSYHFNGKADGTEKEQLSLATGTFRSVTGLIGKVNKRNYKITTPVATIGIRGTDHEPLHIPPNADNSNQDEAGTYDRVNSGGTILTSNAGSILLGPNQVGYVPDSNSPPTRLQQIPGFFSQPLDLGGGGSGTSGSGDSGSGGDSLLLTYISPDSTLLPADSTQQAGLTQLVSTTLLTGAQSAPLNWGGAGAYGELLNGLPSSSSGSISYERNPLITIGSNNELLYLKTTDNSGLFEFNANSAPLLQTGSIQVKDPTTLTPLYTVYWGRWGSGFSVIDNGVQQQSTGDFHYIWTSQVTTTTQLQALAANQMTGYYTNIGHTLPTDQNGTTGNLNYMTMNVDFGAQTVQTGISISMPNNVNWVATGNGSLTQFLNANTSGNSGVALTTGRGGNVTIQTGSSVHGEFVGPNAEGAIASYNMNGNLATGTLVTVNGVVALNR